MGEREIVPYAGWGEGGERAGKGRGEGVDGGGREYNITLSVRLNRFHCQSSVITPTCFRRTSCGSSGF